MHQLGKCVCRLEAKLFTCNHVRKKNNMHYVSVIQACKDVGCTSLSEGYPTILEIVRYVYEEGQDCGLLL